MRFRSLALPAYARFTDFSCELPARTHDLHVFHGSNEAGKSSLLRAIRGLLYGIDARSPDNFLHPYKDLRINAELESRAGRALFVSRRKGTKNTLLDQQGQPLPEAALTEFTGAVDREYFDQVFGLGAAQLQLGAEALLQAQGDRGFALAGADIGGQLLGDALKQLKERADRLYRPRASRHALITPGVKIYREAVRQTRELSIRPADYAELRQQIDTSELQRQEFDQQQRTLEAEMRLLQRSRDALPMLRRYAALQEQLHSLRKFPPVPAAFVESLEQDLTELETRQRACVESKSLLQQVELQLGQLHLQPQVLEHAAANARLIGRQESYLERRERLRQATAAAKEVRLQLQQRAGKLFDDLDTAAAPLHDLPNRALPAALQMRCQQLAGELNRVGAEGETLRDQLETMAQESQQIRSRRLALMQPGSGPDTDADAATQTTRLGLALDQALIAEAALQELQALEQQRDGLLGSIDAVLPTILLPLQSMQDASCAPELPEPPGAALTDAAGLQLRGVAWRCARLPVPLLATLQQHRDSAAVLLQELHRNTQSLRDSEDRRKQLSDELHSLQSSGPLPTETDLLRKREIRQQRWYELAAAWQQVAAAAIPSSAVASTATTPGQAIPREHAQGAVQRQGVLFESADPDADAGTDDEDKAPARPRTRSLPVVSGQPDVMAAERRFLDSLSQTDSVADRLRLEAERIAHGVSLRTRIESCEQQSHKFKLRHSQLDEQQQQWQRQWQTLWSACCEAPLSPVEMLEWREQWQHLRGLSLELEQVLQRLLKLYQQVDAARVELLTAAGRSIDHGTGFAALLQQMRRHQQQLAEAQGSLATLDQQLAEAGEREAQTRLRLEQQQAKIDVARSNWQQLCAQASLPADLDATAALELLEQRETLITEFGEWLRQQQQNEQESQWLAEYEAAVGQVSVELDIAADTTEQQVEKLSAIQQAALEVASQHELLVRTRDERKQALDSANASLASLQESLQRKQLQLEVATTAELSPALAVLRQRAHLEAQAVDLRQDLMQLADGEELEQLQQRVEAIDTDAADAKLRQHQEALRELQAQIEQLLSDRAELLQRQRELDQADTAAVEARQRGSDQAAELQAYSRQYLVTRVAQRFLQAQLDSYREQHQGPLLEHASTRFAHLTCGEFAGLKLDYGDADAIELKAQRGGGQLVPVSGLSDGTRDQLFLSLRLASLQLHFENHEPMPLVVDDLLITFDDRRAEAALELFADLAATTQVLLFTHHQHVVDICGRLPPDKHACVHQLR